MCSIHGLAHAGQWHLVVAGRVALVCRHGKQASPVVVGIFCQRPCQDCSPHARGQGWPSTIHHLRRFSVKELLSFRILIPGFSVPFTSSHLFSSILQRSGPPRAYRWTSSKRTTVFCLSVSDSLHCHHERPLLADRSRGRSGRGALDFAPSSSSLWRRQLLKTQLVVTLCHSINSLRSSMQTTCQLKIFDDWQYPYLPARTSHNSSRSRHKRIRIDL